MQRDEVERDNAKECCKIANARFGYRLGLELLLIGKLGIGGEYAEKMIDAARDRNFDRFEELMSGLNI